MDYKETLEYLFSSLPVYQRVGGAAYKANLDNSNVLDKHLLYPHRKFRSIHIAGTNGKGSVSHMIASILADAGYKTGLYTSPHLRDFTERIKVDGIPVTEEYIVLFVDRYRSLLERLKPSFFEMTVAMAFDYFVYKEVDIAVIETGMGGRLDSTNIITPELSIITNIGLDHTQFLGPDLISIAREKGGIIKPGVPVVIGETQEPISDIFASIAKRCNSDIYFADKEFRVNTLKSDLYKGESHLEIFNGPDLFIEDVMFPLAGSYQKRNVQTVMKAMTFEGNRLEVSKTHIKSGLSNVLKNTKLEGRWQVIRNNPLVICDTAHNHEGLSLTLAQLSEIDCNRRHFVIGFVNDKEISKILRLFPKEAEYYFTSSSVPRSMPGDRVAEIAAQLGLQGESFASVEDAYRSALTHAGKSDVLYIGGSTFVVADLLNIL
jgi:dihydrofolate synthase/folylpolyglutamate synthase